MRKFGKFFVFAAVLLVLAIGGCEFDIPTDAGTEAAVDPTASPPPEGKVWVKIPLSADSARTLTGTNNSAYIDYYEVFFLKRNKGNGTVESDYSASGSAKLGETLAVSVYPDVTYEVLLLAGHYKTTTLMASSYNGAVPIVSGQVNRVDLTLTYITSNPTADYKFNYNGTYATGTAFSPKVTPAAGYYELPPQEQITTASGTDYAIGDRLVLSDPKDGSSGSLTLIWAPVITVTGIGTGGAITNISVENKGWFDASTAVATGTWTRITGTGTGVNANFTFTPVKATDDIPVTIPWLSYINDGTNGLTFEIKTGGLTPLLSAGGPTGEGYAKFKLTQADLRLIPLTDTGGSFIPVPNKVDTGVTPMVTSSTSDITVEYIFENGNLPLPSTNAYGLLYYKLQYRAFGGNMGSGWTIRNGITLNELDKGELSSGAGVLVKIGNPGKYTPKVGVNIPTS
jgi:hypothetical protein